MLSEAALMIKCGDEGRFIDADGCGVPRSVREMTFAVDARKQAQRGLQLRQRCVRLTLHRKLEQRKCWRPSDLSIRHLGGR